MPALNPVSCEYLIIAIQQLVKEHHNGYASGGEFFVRISSLTIAYIVVCHTALYSTEAALSRRWG